MFDVLPFCDISCLGLEVPEYRDSDITSSIIGHLRSIYEEVDKTK